MVYLPENEPACIGNGLKRKMGLTVSEDEAK